MNKGIGAISGLLKGTNNPRVLFAFQNTFTSAGSDTTTSTLWTDLDPREPGPLIVVPESGRYIIDFGCAYARNGTSNNSTAMGFAVNGKLVNRDSAGAIPVELIGTGYDTRNPLTWSFYYEEAAQLNVGGGSNGGSISQQKVMYLRAGDVVCCKYAVGSGTGRFLRNRWLKLTRIN